MNFVKVRVPFRQFVYKQTKLHEFSSRMNSYIFLNDRQCHDVMEDSFQFEKEEKEKKNEIFKFTI